MKFGGQIVSDNANNIVHDVKDVMKLKYFGCFAHSLNLIVQNALKNIYALLEKIKAIIAYFERSTQSNEKLHQFQ
ncbi:hypothetical protein PR048_001489 [Dryococelus australis]|uniref:Uncharacterized protein n=1 Tax=Dryococelus australis TaxID=614101 RepID=A0ABQ9IHM4_9NEOP|nr:hypothetical protein PR048_001489 [Dryococelus australis]